MPVAFYVFLTGEGSALLLVAGAVLRDADRGLGDYVLALVLGTAGLSLLALAWLP